MPSANPTSRVRAVLSKRVGRYNMEQAGLLKDVLYNVFFSLYTYKPRPNTQTAAPHSAAQNSTQHNTQHSTAQHSTAQHPTYKC